MPPNNSSTGGFLAPTSTPPLEDAALDALLQQLVVGVTSMDGTLVRPRWQTIPPKQPELTVDWCAIGVTDEEPDDNAVIIHHPDGNGFDETRRQEVLTVLASFYGPNSRGNAKLLRDGLQVGQNRETLFWANAGLVDVGRVTAAPELVNQHWIKRADMTFRVRRAVIRTYPVENLTGAKGTIHTVRGPAGTENNEPWAVTAP